MQDVACPAVRGRERNHLVSCHACHQVTSDPAGGPTAFARIRVISVRRRGNGVQFARASMSAPFVCQERIATAVSISHGRIAGGTRVVFSKIQARRPFSPSMPVMVTSIVKHSDGGRSRGVIGCGPGVAGCGRAGRGPGEHAGSGEAAPDPGVRCRAFGEGCRAGGSSRDREGRRGDRGGLSAVCGSVVA